MLEAVGILDKIALVALVSVSKWGKKGPECQRAA